MKKTVKTKEYLLKMPNSMYVEIDKYAEKNDLDVAKVIRKAIRLLINKGK